MKISIDEIKKLREETAAGVMACREALLRSGGDLAKAKEILRREGLDRAAARGGREVGAGLVEAYVHNSRRLGALVELNCETDFVARNELFKHLAHEIAMQVASMNPQTVEELLRQAYIREPQKTVGELIAEAVAKLGENIKVGGLARYEV